MKNFVFLTPDFLFFCYLLGNLNSCSSVVDLERKISIGHLVTNENWALLAKYNFRSLHGKFEYEIEYNKEKFGVVSLLMYPDNKWKTWMNQTCQGKNDVLSIQKKQIVELNLLDEEAGCESITHANLSGSSMTISCKSMRAFSTTKDRLWYIAVSNCNSTQGLNLRYNFTMTTGNEKDMEEGKNKGSIFHAMNYASSLCISFLLLM